MRKRISILFLALILILNLPIPVLAADTGPWVFGREGTRLTQNCQGLNGFYYMFTRQFNTGGTYDPAQFDYLIWSTNTTWRFFGGAAWTPPYTGAQIPDRFYNPDAVNEHGQPEGIDDYWFGIFGDGRILPSANFSPVVRWVAPVTGNFIVDVNVRAGINDQFFNYYTMDDARDFPRVDGVRVTIMHERAQLFTADSGLVRFDQNRINVPRLEINMQAGEALFFITDQNADPAWDFTNWLITIERGADLPTHAEEPEATPPPEITEEPTVTEAPLSGDEPETDDEPEDGQAEETDEQDDDYEDEDELEEPEEDNEPQDEEPLETPTPEDGQEEDETTEDDETEEEEEEIKPTQTPDEEENNDDHYILADESGGMGTGAVVGIIAAALVIAGAGAFSFFWIKKRTNKGDV